MKLRTQPLLFVILCFSVWGVEAVTPGPTENHFQEKSDLLVSQESPITTFSIVAWDPETGDYGVGVQSKYFAVGDVVPFAWAETGALATQARGNPVHGNQALELLRRGLSADAVLERLMRDDQHRDSRQVGLVDGKGRAASYTGNECLPWAGGLIGDHYAVQGNLLAGPEVVEAMAAVFEASDGDLATRLVYALAAGQAAGGDARGRQSAAVLVVRKGAGYLGLNDRHIDLHVEDHPTPIRELKRLLDIRHAQLASAAAKEYLAKLPQADDGQRAELIHQARESAEEGLGFYRGDDNLWWLVARTRWLDNDLPGAAEAARKALLISPSWPRLPASTRRELGVDDDLLGALRGQPGFSRFWDSLSGESRQ